MSKRQTCSRLGARCASATGGFAQNFSASAGIWEAIKCWVSHFCSAPPRCPLTFPLVSKIKQIWKCKMKPLWDNERKESESEQQELGSGPQGARGATGWVQWGYFFWAGCRSGLLHVAQVLRGGSGTQLSWSVVPLQMMGSSHTAFVLLCTMHWVQAAAAGEPAAIPREEERHIPLIEAFLLCPPSWWSPSHCFGQSGDKQWKMNPVAVWFLKLEFGG